MDLFNNLFNVLMGKTNTIDKPIFTKPYVDKTYDMLELSRRLDQAPEESKALFRDQMETLALKIKTHQAVHDLLEQSALPILILYDLHILTPAGSATMDYVVLSNRFLLVISCADGEEVLTAEKARSMGAPTGSPRIPICEHSGYIFTELLKSEQLVDKKHLGMVWPVTVDARPESETHQPRASESIISSRSLAFPEIRKEEIIHPEDLVNHIKKLFQFDDAFTWLSNKEIIAISDTLLRYEEQTK